MKKLLLLLLPIMLLLTSCGANVSEIRSNQLTALMNEEGEKILKMSKEIVRCFTEKDKEGLKNLFCEQVRNNPQFDKQIDDAFEYFKCDVYTTSEYDTTASGGESIEKGKRVSWDVSPEIPYIATLYENDKDSTDVMQSRYYSMNYYWYIVNDEDKSLEGLQCITIEFLNVDSIELGEYIG